MGRLSKAPTKNHNPAEENELTEPLMDHQTKYNKKMKLSRKKQRSFKVDYYVTIKMNKVDKTTPLHPNTILGKIIDLEENGNCAKVVTKFGKIVT